MYTVQKCICTAYTVDTYSTGPYVHNWYSYTLHKMRLSIP